MKLSCVCACFKLRLCDVEDLLWRSNSIALMNFWATRSRITRQVVARLFKVGAGRGDLGLGICDVNFLIGRIKTRQQLTFFNAATDLGMPRDDFARDAEAEAALRSAP